jgi:hypothetical protein
MSFENQGSKERNRILSREDAVEHFEELLSAGSSYNESMYPADIVPAKDALTDVLIFFRSDSGEYATTSTPYTIFLNRYNIANGRIPSYKFKYDVWNDVPCLRVSITE